MKNTTLVFVFLFAFCLGKSQTVTPPTVQVQEFYTGLNGPVGIYHCGDHRLFVIEKNAGEIEIIDTTGAYIGTFLSIPGLISTGSERGLLGLAFHPNYQTNGYFYINYTNTSGNTVIARYQVGSNPNVANASSATILLTITQPFGNHNGGHIAFGPDGYLYIGMGDGGSAGDPGARAQNLQELLGKMLRIDVDNGSPYSVPASNPFVGNANAQDEIWAYGLRNPWKFSFDRETGELWIADVGQNLWEEVNVVSGSSTGGENYGWRCYEGNVSYNTTGCAAIGTMTFPIAVFSHSAPTSFCSITGGAVYRGDNYSALQGIFFFTDYCSGILYGISENATDGYVTTNYGSAGSAVTAIQEDSSGEIYIVRQGGTIGRIKDACGLFNPQISVNEEGLLESTTAASYWWYNEENIISGATAQTFGPVMAGLYSVNASNGTCTRSSNQIPWVVMGGIPGCTYENALNFDPNATIDDGTCTFGATAGCPGDMDGNGVIGANDLILFLASFGTFCN